MALFQEAIIRKHLLTLDAHVLDSAYNEYKRVYSPEKIKNIRVAKEEQYQEGFIKEIFGSVLGYSVYPESPFNIETEKKNETNAKKADGAILSGEKVVGVIELKDNKTKNLDAVKDQAFGYKNNHKDCSYVISSNFHKLRFYIDDATDYEEFDLYNLDKETFKRFYLYLRKEGLLDKNLPKLLRQETKFHEEEISKKLYKDYSNFKRRFFENAVQNNPQHGKLELFKKSQKFLDRILFLLFAEDKGLVGTNSIVSIVEKWSGADDDYYQPLYEMVNKYFGHLYRGYTYQKTGEVIPQFGGELFAPDELLESLKVNDEVLKNDLLILSKYDFNTDVDVNILGHIFEHSLNEVDDVEAELRGETLDKSKSKRKKDGVFYTPKYITKYMVDNTLGKLCFEKKIELKLDEDIAIFEYQKADGKLNEKGKELFERLNTYKSWLLTLKVCDPACGSGAFLNQALSFFIEEHKFVDDIIAELTNTPLRLFDTDLQILENNIFGVDINEESVEIAKLSMWLRTAQPGRKLSDLSNNIKCGNSLIDDPAVAGDKSFNWEKEFPTVFEKGGFDVVIGNPPYVNANDIKKNSTELEYNFLKKSYKTAKGTVDLYIYFFERGLSITKKNGCLSYITPNRFLSASYGKAFREYLLSNYKLLSLVDYSDKAVFQDASTYPVITFISNQTCESKYNVICGKFQDTTKELISTNYPSDQLDILDDSILGFLLNDKIDITLKIFNQSVPLSEAADINATSTASEADNYSSLINEKSGYKLVNTGTIDPYITTWGINELTDKGNKYLNPFLPVNSTIISQNRNKLYSNPKIIISKIGLSCEAFYDKEGVFASINTNCLYNFKDTYSPEYVLCLLNSKLYNFTFECLFDGLRMSGGYLLYSAPNLKNTKIKPLSEQLQKPFLIKANLITDLLENFQNLSHKFSKYFREKYNLLKIPGKLEKWYLLEFVDFIKELSKAIKGSDGIQLSKKDEFEWMELFEENKNKVLNLKIQIDQTNKEIDYMVYELYGLTEKEIQTVENS